VFEDRLLERAQGRSRLEADLVDHHAVGFAIRIECVRLSAVAVEREHQLAPQSLSQRVLAGKRGDLADQRALPAERELGLEAGLPGLEVQLFELTLRSRREELTRQIRERVPAPLRQPVAQHLCGCRVLGACECVAAASQGGLESPQVDVLARNRSCVPRRPREHDLRPERLTQRRDVALQRRHRGGRRPLPHSSSTRRSVATVSPPASRSSASTLRGFGPPSETAFPSITTSSGPSSRKSRSRPRKPDGTSLS
jgi:hypothetical protein